MKALVLYYSRTGTTKRLAEELSRKLGCDIKAIVPKDSYRYITGWLRAGKHAMKGFTDELEPVRNDLGSYDVVIVGTPIWAGTISSPVRTFLAKDGHSIKRAAFFITSGGENRDVTFKAMEDAYGNPPLARLGLKTREVKKGECGAKADAFIAEIRKAVA
jgi:flavodoxin